MGTEITRFIQRFPKIQLGSPPQVRGKLNVMKYLVALNRITPAGAGKTQLFNNINIDIKDHPRRCGENITRLSRRKKRLGSPPQVRGKLNFSCSLLGVTRITPAGAGKTISLCPERAIARDHPRRCGENCRGRRNTPEIPGSPPQVRGKLLNPP